MIITAIIITIITYSFSNKYIELVNDYNYNYYNYKIVEIIIKMIQDYNFIVIFWDNKKYGFMVILTIFNYKNYNYCHFKLSTIYIVTIIIIIAVIIIIIIICNYNYKYKYKTFFSQCIYICVQCKKNHKYVFYVFKACMNSFKICLRKESYNVFCSL